MNDVAFGDRLLAVDDEPAIGRLIRKAAQGAGFEVVVTDSPETFSRTARYWHPTVILLDLRMPGTDGVQLLRMLAADKCAAHVVVVSGSDGKVLDSAMQLGHERGLNMSGMLQKPIRLEDLRDMLARFKRAPKALMAADLAEAIAFNRLFLEYQPKLDPRVGRFTGVEALVRWRDPSHGVIRPDQFIPLAEETGQIHRLTDWVVAEAARQVVEWVSPDFIESFEFDDPVETLESLTFILNRLLQQVCARLAARSLATNEFRLKLELEARQLQTGEKKEFYERSWKLPLPIQDAKVLFRLAYLDLETNLQTAPIQKIIVQAIPVKPRFAQGGLFNPASPEAEQLEITSLGEDDFIDGFRLIYPKYGIADRTRNYLAVR